jgi:hypothetical protein
MFVGLSKTTHKTRIPQEKNSAEKHKCYFIKQMCFSVNDGNAVALKYSDLRTTAREQLPKDGHLRLKNVAVDCDNTLN